jgi:eukaryotic-like serine/threonine-protein kinase
VPALPQTSDDLLRLVERSGLLPIDQIQQHFGEQQLPGEAVSFAKWMIQQGLLTTFQADQLLQGKSRGFFLGNYQVLQPLGGGGTAGVFLCEHRVMKNRVAVKVLCQTRMHENANMLPRFRREARAAAALSHPNIVRTIDFDEDQGRHFLVMEYVDGVTLEQWLKQNPNPPLRTLVHFVLQAAHGLQHIHESGLIHRDIKPANLLLDKQGTVKILDLGLAKFTDDDLQDDLSQMEGGILGTVDFMSPEQANCTFEQDIRSDIYGLGATLYYLVSGGNAPFPANSLGAKLIAIQSQQPRPIRDYRPDVDTLLDKIVCRMMARDPDKRFQAPKEAVAVLYGWLSRTAKNAGTGTKSAPGHETMVAEGTEERPLIRPLSKPPIVRRPVVRARPTGQPFAEQPGYIAPQTVARPRLGPSRGPVRSSRSAWKWSVRTLAGLLLIGALAALKPWNLVHQAMAQSVVSAK